MPLELECKVRQRVTLPSNKDGRFSYDVLEGLGAPDTFPTYAAAEAWVLTTIRGQGARRNLGVAIFEWTDNSWWSVRRDWGTE